MALGAPLAQTQLKGLIIIWLMWLKISKPILRSGLCQMRIGDVHKNRKMGSRLGQSQHAVDYKLDGPNELLPIKHQEHVTKWLFRKHKESLISGSQCCAVASRTVCGSFVNWGLCHMIFIFIFIILFKKRSKFSLCLWAVGSSLVKSACVQ